MRKKLSWIAVLVWILIIFSWSLQSGEDSGRVSGSLTQSVLNFLSSVGREFSYDAAHHFIRKAAHFTEYAVLGALTLHAQKKAPLFESDALSIGLFMLVPVIDETIQRFVPQRAGMGSDVLLDMCGFLSAVLVLSLISHRGQWQRRSRR
jgi:VanZ family protein